MREQPESLSAAEWRLLHYGMDSYLDLLLADLSTILSGGTLKDTLVLRDVLPAQFVSWYTPIFLKQFVVCGINLTAKIDNWQDGLIAACTAEELAFRGLIEWVPTLCEPNITSATVEHLQDFREETMQDFDVDMLFNFALDGIEGDEVMGNRLGLDALRPENWFQPFAGLQVHPYCRNFEIESD
jgi:hypothetical protein